MWWSIGGGIIIFALGMFIFLRPGLIWKLTEEWKSYRADEPSEFYLKTTKIGGILFALFGIIMIMLPVIAPTVSVSSPRFTACSTASLYDVVVIKHQVTASNVSTTYPLLLIWSFESCLNAFKSNNLEKYPSSL